MKGSKNFEDILKSDNDVSLGRGAHQKIKKNFDIPEANDKPKKKKKTDGTENETSLSINRTMDPISRKVVPENQNAELSVLVTMPYMPMTLRLIKKQWSITTQFSLC